MDTRILSIGASRDERGRMSRNGSLNLHRGHVLALLLFGFSPLLAQNSIREQYNYTYSDLSEQATFSHSPNAFLVDFTKTLKPGRALDIGMGQGRNAIYLAQQGWEVTGFDLSDAGVNLAREQEPPDSG